MFSSPFSHSAMPRSGAARHSAVLYSQVGVESRLAGATPHQLVAMLFDGYMEALAQARGAMVEGRLAEKGAALGRAVRIVEEGLRAGLDLKAGGTLARDLDDLYRYLCTRLTVANLRNDLAALEECRRLVLPLQEAWGHIAPRTGA